MDNYNMDGCILNFTNYLEWNCFSRNGRMECAFYCRNGRGWSRYRPGPGSRRFLAVGLEYGGLLLAIDLERNFKHSYIHLDIYKHKYIHADTSDGGCIAI